ncbi:MAG: MerR family transcriptional regulator [Desulfuromonadaceae bacterium]|nr:MerR family transcriptional regulator [Desulfuromonadaceae bacterium]
MALMKTWYEVDAAADKFGIARTKLLFWVEEGLVRCEREGGHVVRVHIDDVRMQVNDSLENPNRY